jgi:hypothetical protein
MHALKSWMQTYLCVGKSINNPNEKVEDGCYVEDM